MNQNFAAIILGGTGQVGGKAVSELLEIPECREVVMVTGKAHCTTITGTKAIESHELSQTSYWRAHRRERRTEPSQVVVSATQKFSTIQALLSPGVGISRIPCRPSGD
jgi:hypothetical protein